MTRMLTDEQVAQFHEQGFLRIDNVFAPEEMDALNGACDRVYSNAERLVADDVVNAQSLSTVYEGSKFTYQFNDEDWAIRHVAMCGQCEPVFDAYGQDQRLLQVAGELLKIDRVEQQINQIHYKKPGSAVAFKWHQDAQHRGIARGTWEDMDGKGSYVQIAIAIDDVTESSGPLGFVPGSNQHGFLGQLYDDADHFICDKVNLDEAVFPLLKRGDIVAFGSYTVHGSKPNIGETFRRTFINGFAYPGASKKTTRLQGEGRTLQTGYETK